MADTPYFNDEEVIKNNFAKTKRKPVNITSIDYNLVALCDDGTIWKYDHCSKIWFQLPKIPQD
jgi:hypothetical protein